MSQIQTTPPVLQIPSQAPLDVQGLGLFMSTLVQALNNWAVQLLTYLYPLAPTFIVANLPTNAKLGTVLTVTDGTAALAWGATVTGGSTTKYLVWWNGANWTVVGK